MLKSNNYKEKRIDKIIFFLLCFVSLAWMILSVDVRRFLNTEIQEFQSFFTTFSNPTQLFDDGEKKSFSDMSSGDFLIFVENLAGVVMSGGNYEDNSNQKEIKLFIKFKNLEKIYRDREAAITNGINIDPREVPCKISDGLNTFKCKVRLKGDLSDHWNAKKRLSLRIEVKDGYIHGFKDFAIQKPSTRTFPYDQTFHHINSSLGRFSSNSQSFMNISVNGEAWGKMNIEPIVDDRFIEVRDVKRSGVFRISNQDSWAYSRNQGFYKGHFISDPTLTVSQRGNEQKLFENLSSLEIYSHISKNISEKRGEIFNRQIMVGNLVFSLAWGYLHPLYNSNAWYTWNAYEQKLEPILTDQGIWEKASVMFEELNDLPFEYKILFQHKPLQKNELLYELNKIKGYFIKESSLKIANNFKDQNFSNDNRFKYTPVDGNLNYLIQNLDYVVNTINSLAVKDNEYLANEEEITEDQIALIENFIKILHFRDGLIRIYNLMDIDVDLDYLLIDGEKKFLSKTIRGSRPTNLEYIDIQTDYKGDYSNEINIKASVGEQSKVTINQFSLMPSPSNDAEYNSLCMSNDNDSLCEIKGDHQISNTVIFTKKVVIRPGSNLILKNNADLIFLSSIDMLGNENSVIKFIGDKTGGIFIKNNTEQESKIIFTSFDSLSTTSTYLRKYTGAINGYGGLFTLKNVSVKNSSSEDQLNLIDTKVSIEGLKISNAPSDAFDCDFCTGKIKNINFVNVSGDGLDVSGSDLKVYDLKAFGIKDKALSVGERSIVFVDRFQATNVATGIASKDSSRVIANNISLDQIEYDAFMTYVKKPFFKGETYLEVNNLFASNNVLGKICVRENNTKLYVQDSLCDISELNIDELYEGRMKK